MQTLQILDKTYNAEDHWFWKTYSPDIWEPETLETFKKYLTKDIIFIDIGAWLGVTIMYAHALGCETIFGIEANPVSFKLLESNCNLNGIKAHLSNICICDRNELVSFGSEGHYTNTSSASSMRGNEFTVQGVTFSTYLSQLPEILKNNLFVKIDIEGAEELLVDDLVLVNGIIYLSIHVPFLKDKQTFYNKLKRFKVLDAKLEEKIMSSEEFPSWGTQFGNFFEVVIDNRV